MKLKIDVAEISHNVGLRHDESMLVQIKLVFVSNPTYHLFPVARSLLPTRSQIECFSH